MKISVIGMNQDELLSGKNLAEMGNEVIYVCKDDKRIDDIKRGYYSNNEEKIIKSIKKREDIDFTSDLREALDGSNMCFISESKGEDTSALFRILANAKAVGENMCHHTFIVDRSKLSINRTHKIKETIQSELDKRHSNLTFEVISDSSFLRA